MLIQLTVIDYVKVSHFAMLIYSWNEQLFPECILDFRCSVLEIHRN